MSSVRLADKSARPWLARAADGMDSSSCSLERLELNIWDVRDRSVPVIEGLSVVSSPRMPFEESLSAVIPIPEATKSPIPYVLVEETSLRVAVDDVLKTSLDDLKVSCPVADVVFWKDTLVIVPFCDDEDEARALNPSNRRSTSERDEIPKRTSAIVMETRTKRRRTRKPNQGMTW